MRAIILAAGVGQRLAAANGGAPKCLLRIGEESLLERHLRLLQSYGITAVTLVVGYEAGQIKAEIERLAPAPAPVLCFNPDYRQGSVVSLWAARDALTAGGDVLLMDADVLYDPRMIERLKTSAQADCFLLDRDFEPGPEPVKLCVRDGRLVEFRKQLDPALCFDSWGESVGFFRFSEQGARRLAEQVQFYVETGRGDQPHEEAIRDLLLEDPEHFGYEDVTGLAWIEIDFPEDVQRAREQILPRIAASL